MMDGTELILELKPLEEEVKLLSRVRLFATLWTVAHQVPLSMGFSRQDYWNGLLFPSPDTGGSGNYLVRPRIRAFVPRRKNHATQ